MGLPAELDATIVRGNDFQRGLTITIDTKTVTDGVTVDGDTHVHSPSGLWVSGDVGKAIYGTNNIPFGTTIATYVSATEMVLSQPAAEDGTGQSFLWGTTVDVSGWQFSSEIKGRADYTTGLVDVTFDDSQGSAGLLRMSLTAAQTKLLPTGPLAWDIVAVISGQRTTLFKGTFTVEDGVTL